eukprot:scaffold342552_cov67-Attheya_sp.AAC.1
MVGALPVEAVAVLRLVLAWAARAFFDIYSAVVADIGGSLDFLFITGTAAWSKLAPVGMLGWAMVELDKETESLFVTRSRARYSLVRIQHILYWIRRSLLELDTMFLSITCLGGAKDA